MNTTQNKELLIFHIEDNPDDAGLAERALRKAGYSFKIHRIISEEELIDQLDQVTPDLVLCDHSLPGFNSLEAFRVLNERHVSVPFILLTGSVSETFAVDCLLMGMDDYILKTNMIRLPSSVERVLSKKRLRNEKETIERLHSELRDSINYARRIQDAVLPGLEEMESKFNDVFIYFEPQDIVSGDMYWLGETKTTDGRNLAVTVLAVYDCTGHGIPGALMSLMSFALLNETLKNRWINSPADVLTYMNKKLPAILNKRGGEAISDGFDIAICAFDSNKNKLYFSGAKRPLWILRKEQGEVKLLEFKGARVGISWQTEENFVFENTEIQLEKEDRVFLFSDGISDQFGGTKGKKLTSQGLRDLLLNSGSLPFSEQKDFLTDFFDTWKQGYEQTDDQLFIALEF